MDFNNGPSLFINMVSNDHDAAVAFYTSLGFKPLTYCTDENTKAFHLPEPNQKICIMIHKPGRFKTFIRPKSDIVNSQKTTEVLFTITAPNREVVDEYLAKAIKAGGVGDPFVLDGYGDEHGMYSRAFADPDGHLWEAFCAIPEKKIEKEE